MSGEVSSKTSGKVQISEGFSRLFSKAIYRITSEKNSDGVIVKSLIRFLGEIWILQGIYEGSHGKHFLQKNFRRVHGRFCKDIFEGFSGRVNREIIGKNSEKNHGGISKAIYGRFSKESLENVDDFFEKNLWRAFQRNVWSNFGTHGRFWEGILAYIYGGISRELRRNFYRNLWFLKRHLLNFWGYSQ